MSKDIAVKAHTRYRLADGTLVPGVTTITGQVGKEALIHWAWDLGMKGIDYRATRDRAADIGTLAHALAVAEIAHQEVNTSAYSPADVDKAENALLSFYEWLKGKTIEPVVVETPLVSEVHRFGGTPDIYCILDGTPTLIDLKTGKGIYDEYFLQVAAYRVLLEEHGHKVEQVRILRIGREESEGFEERVVTDTTAHWRAFRALLDYYYAAREAKKK